MADKFDITDNEAGNTGNESSGTSSERPGSDSGTRPVENGDSGIAGGTVGVEGIAPNVTASGTIRKRRAGGGRKPYPRDADGNIIRDGAASNQSGAKGLGLRNDRVKVRMNIAGLHAMAAILTKQPILALNDKEADALSASVCDVADYHGINLITAGGAFGLYASLATTCYMIYVPRLVMIKGQKTNAEDHSPTPGEAREDAIAGAGKMNFGPN